MKSGIYFLPPSLPEGAQDLIRRMLIIEPEQRITMEGIKSHPWFKSNMNILPEAFPIQVLFIFIFYCLKFLISLFISSFD